MPEIKGTDFLSEVAEKYPNSFRVLLTGSIGFGEVIHDIGDGTVHFFLPKPWTEDYVRNMFERAGVHLAHYPKGKWEMTQPANTELRPEGALRR
ncbi:MAG: hypothetical protein QOJ64_2367 [Acidobacteriota bacterium]|jgi:FixJ family two-component response regulator|nr:hypothetical protein [Acidobacteriota bacterium]